MKTCWGVTKKVEFCRKPTGGKLLCDQHRTQPLYFIIIAITGVLFSYISGLIPKAPLPWEQNLYASPTSVTLHNGDWSVKTPLAVWNRGDKPVHSVWVKIGLMGKGVSAESLVVTIPLNSSTFEGRIGNVVVSADTYRLNTIDSSGHEAVFIVIRTIPPTTHREFVVSGSIPVQSHATIKVVSSSTEEVTMLETPGKIAFPFKPPEDLKLKGFSLLMRKE